MRQQEKDGPCSIFLGLKATPHWIRFYGDPTHCSISRWRIHVKRSRPSTVSTIINNNLIESLKRTLVWFLPWTAMHGDPFGTCAFFLFPFSLFFLLTLHVLFLHIIHVPNSFINIFCVSQHQHLFIFYGGKFKRKFYSFILVVLQIPHFHYREKYKLSNTWL